MTVKTKTGAGLYFTSPGGISTVVQANGTLRSTPIYFDRTVTLSAIGIEVTAIGDASGPVVRLGVYADDGDGHPGRLILDAGTVPAIAVGWHETAISLTLPPGLYWFGSVTQGVVTTAPTVRSTIGAAIFGLAGIGSTTALTASQNGGVGYQLTGVTGALPDPFTTAPPAGLSANAHRVCVKVT